MLPLSFIRNNRDLIIERLNQRNFNTRPSKNNNNYKAIGMVHPICLPLLFPVDSSRGTLMSSISPHSLKTQIISPSERSYGNPPTNMYDESRYCSCQEPGSPPKRPRLSSSSLQRLISLMLFIGFYFDTILFRELVMSFF